MHVFWDLDNLSPQNGETLGEVIAAIGGTFPRCSLEAVNLYANCTAFTDPREFVDRSFFESLWSDQEREMVQNMPLQAPEGAQFTLRCDAGEGLPPARLTVMPTRPQAADCMMVLDMMRAVAPVSALASPGVVCMISNDTDFKCPLMDARRAGWQVAVVSNGSMRGVSDEWVMWEQLCSTAPRVASSYRCVGHRRLQGAEGVDRRTFASGSARRRAGRQWPPSGQRTERQLRRRQEDVGAAPVVVGERDSDACPDAGEGVEIDEGEEEVAGPGAAEADAGATEAADAESSADSLESLCGPYTLCKDALVSGTAELGTPPLGRLARGAKVVVLEVREMANEERIRGRIAYQHRYGWMSLRSTDGSLLWAKKTSDMQAEGSNCSQASSQSAGPSKQTPWRVHAWAATLSFPEGAEAREASVAAFLTEAGEPQSTSAALEPFLFDSSLGLPYLLLSPTELVEGTAAPSREEYAELLRLAGAYLSGCEARGASLVVDFEGEMPGHGGVLATAVLQATSAVGWKTLEPMAPEPLEACPVGLMLDLGDQDAVALLQRAMESPRLTKFGWGSDGDCKSLMFQKRPAPLRIRPKGLVDAQLAFSGGASHRSRLGMGRMMWHVPKGLRARLPQKGEIDFASYHARNCAVWRLPLDPKVAAYAVDDAHRLDAILRSMEPRDKDFDRAAGMTEKVLKDIQADPLGIRDLKRWMRVRSLGSAQQQRAKAVAVLRHITAARKHSSEGGFGHQDGFVRSVEAMAARKLPRGGVCIPDDLSFNNSPFDGFAAAATRQPGAPAPADSGAAPDAANQREVKAAMGKAHGAQ